MEILGQEGITQCCLDAIVRLLSYSDNIQKAFLISNFDSTGRFGTHSFILLDCFEDASVIRSGFTSGYPGEGPTGLSIALSFMIKHEIEVDEIAVSTSDLKKLNNGRMNNESIEKLLSRKPVRPTRYYAYIQGRHGGNSERLKSLYPVRIPFGLIDGRIMDLALRFAREPDISLLNGYRRLEDLIRKRTGFKEISGSKLFSKAFIGDNAPLCWEGMDSTEAIGKANLFSAIYMSYRNKRAHKVLNTTEEESIREFLLLNELFVLESSSEARKVSEPEKV